VRGGFSTSSKAVAFAAIRPGPTGRTASVVAFCCASDVTGIIFDSDAVADFPSSCRLTSASGNIVAALSFGGNFAGRPAAVFIASFFASASGTVGAGLSRIDGFATRPVPSFIASFFCKILSLNSSTRFVFCGPPVKFKPAFPFAMLFFSSSGAT
jgi:hypothetical protein